MGERAFKKYLVFIFGLIIIMMMLVLANMEIIVVLMLIFNGVGDGSSWDTVSHFIRPWSSGAKCLLACLIVIIILTLNSFVKIKGIHVFQIIGAGISIFMTFEIVNSLQLSLGWKIIVLAVLLFIILKIRRLIYSIIDSFIDNKFSGVSQRIMAREPMKKIHEAWERIQIDFKGKQ